MVKFLIIRFSSIGDIVLTTPVIRCLKNQVEDAEIHFLSKKQYTPILIANPYIDKLHTLDDSLLEIIHSLKHEYLDYIIDLHKNIRSFIVKSRLRLMTFSVNKINLAKWLMVNFKLNRLPDQHIVDRYIKTIHLFNVNNDGKGLDYFIPETDKVDLKNMSERFSEGFIAFVVGAKHETKRLPIDKMIAICKNLTFPVILLGGKEDETIGNEIISACNGNIYNACGKYNINQSASLIKQSKLVITHDTGLMHIASAFRKKIISVWGNTIPEFGMYPYQPDPSSKIFEVKGLSCRPCSKIGYHKCPKKHFRCMKDIDTDKILQTISEII